MTQGLWSTWMLEQHPKNPYRTPKLRSTEVRPDSTPRSRALFLLDRCFGLQLLDVPHARP